VREQQRREEAAGAKPFRGHNAKRQEVKESKEVREHRERQERAFAFLRRADARQERMYGPRTFPLVEQLRRLEQSPKDFRLDEEKGFRSLAEVAALTLRSYYERMAACEVVLWGGVEPATAAEIERLSAEVRRLAVERVRERLAEEKRRESERQEREEKYRREREEREQQRLERERERVRPAVAPFHVEDEPPAQYIPSEDKADPNDPEYWSRAVERAKGGRVGMVYIPPEEAKPQPPPDNGTDGYYHFRLGYWKETGVWPTDEMLSRRR
jgi:hypothetical protein